MDPPTTEQRAESLTFTPRCDMPDLSGLQSNSRMYLGRNWLTGQGFLDDRIASSALRSLVRLVDKALASYENARVSLTRYAERENNEDSSVILGYLAGIDHLETCFNALSRANTLGRWLRMCAPELAIDQHELLIGRDRRMLSSFRNRSEHLLDNLKKARIGEDEHITMQPGVTKVAFSQPGVDGYEAVRYADLAEWISRLHALAGRLADHPRPAPE